MVQTTLYADVLAKMGALRSLLLDEGKLRALMDSKSLTDVVGQMHETTYEKQIAALASPINSRKLERAFNENLIETQEKIIKHSPKKASTFLKLYLQRYEVENVKTLIKTSNANLNPKQKTAKLYLSAETSLKNREVIEEAAKAPDLKQTITALRKTEYAQALKMGMVSYQEDGTTACFDVLLDKHFYEKFYDAYQCLPAKEKPHAYPYASLEHDGFVLLALLRGKNLQYDPNWLRLALPTKTFELPCPTIEDLVLAVDFDSALKIAQESSMGKFFAKAESPHATLGNAEKALKKAVLLHAKAGRFTELFNVGAVLAFLVQKEAEVRSLIAICLGVEASFKPVDIERQLLL